MRGIIAAVSPDGVIGLHGAIPWHYRGDLARFRQVTWGSAVIMGRITWTSLPKPLAGRRNVVITRSPIDGVECYPSIPLALSQLGGVPVWFIGGARIYEEAMRHADVLDVTYVPDRIVHPEAITFPPIDEKEWLAGELQAHEEDARLSRRIYTRKTAASGGQGETP